MGSWGNVLSTGSVFILLVDVPIIFHATLYMEQRGGLGIEVSVRASRAEEVRKTGQEEFIAPPCLIVSWKLSFWVHGSFFKYLSLLQGKDPVLYPAVMYVGG